MPPPLPAAPETLIVPLDRLADVDIVCARLTGEVGQDARPAAALRGSLQRGRRDRSLEHRYCGYCPALGKDGDLDRMRAYIREARQRNSSRLPPEGRLAEEIGVTRARLRGLLKKLEGEGLIWRHVGKGTFVGERSMTPQLSALPDMITPLEAFEARLVIEPQLAAMAALRATPKQIADMRDCLVQMQHQPSFDQWAVWDERLHRLVAKAAHNALLLALYDTVRESAPSGMRNRMTTVFGKNPRAETNHEHHDFVDAVAERDPGQAEQLMRAHLLSIRLALFGERCPAPGATRRRAMAWPRQSGLFLHTSPMPPNERDTRCILRKTAGPGRRRAAAPRRPGCPSI